ncbi:MAG: DNA-3-methyladenine glycosylase [Anaerolineae bacterium]
MLLPDSFFARPTPAVARDLLGQKLVRRLDGEILSGMVVETEAYLGQADTACHAHRGRTPRTEVMFGPPGVAYVYFVYGMHYMLNVVTEAEGVPCAVLIRAIEPLQGRARMQALRQTANHHLADGPARLCQALAIDKTLNRRPVTTGDALWFEAYRRIPAADVACGPRVGIRYAAPADRRAPHRFWIRGNRHVSPGPRNEM